eukprot:XP_001697978.1 predicted protein [Chlamydomonas reinhardtii]
MLAAGFSDTSHAAHVRSLLQQEESKRQSRLDALKHLEAEASRKHLASKWTQVEAWERRENAATAIQRGYRAWLRRTGRYPLKSSRQPEPSRPDTRASSRAGAASSRLLRTVRQPAPPSSSSVSFSGGSFSAGAGREGSAAALQGAGSGSIKGTQQRSASGAASRHARGAPGQLTSRSPDPLSPDAARGADGAVFAVSAAVMSPRVHQTPRREQLGVAAGVAEGPVPAARSDLAPGPVLGGRQGQVRRGTSWQQEEAAAQSPSGPRPPGVPPLQLSQSPAATTSGSSMLPPIKQTSAGAGAGGGAGAMSNLASALEAAIGAGCATPTYQASSPSYSGRTSFNGPPGSGLGALVFSELPPSLSLRIGGDGPAQGSGYPAHHPAPQNARRGAPSLPANTMLVGSSLTAKPPPLAIALGNASNASAASSPSGAAATPGTPGGGGSGSRRSLDRIRGHGHSLSGQVGLGPAATTGSGMAVGMAVGMACPDPDAPPPTCPLPGRVGHHRTGSGAGVLPPGVGWQAGGGAGAGAGDDSEGGGASLVDLDVGGVPWSLASAAGGPAGSFGGGADGGSLSMGGSGGGADQLTSNDKGYHKLNI